MRKQENFGVWNIDVRTTQMTFGVQEKSKKKKKRNPGANSTWPQNPHAPTPGPAHSVSEHREDPAL